MREEMRAKRTSLCVWLKK
ncbi:hypothetical protein Gotur_004992 [Gossypium turneri]